MKPLRRIRRRSQAGFTMIEIMMALLISAVAAAGVIALFITQTRASGFSRHASEASVLAQDQLERLRISGFVGTDSQIGINESGVLITGGVFDRTWTVTNVGVCPACYSEMVVQVSWNEDGGGHQITLRTKRGGL